MISNRQIAMCIHQDNEMSKGRWLWSTEEFKSEDMEAVRDIEDAIKAIRKEALNQPWNDVLCKLKALAPNTRWGFALQDIIRDAWHCNL